MKFDFKVLFQMITMSAVREWDASQGSKLSGAVAVNNLGKWKTTTQMTSLTILLAIRDPRFIYNHQFCFGLHRS
ncbi:hypothetical protein L1987_21828 [Smallanthus sonchifolius]|uniref:Uncharacterized protein n=1 Tax=Smallanthus sonchifolius TaxID=185202 RepID=A0ACB9IEX5_9ASTR|nr:hypothetical protein L1987_21828 [Smallanthus sonchifolius]